MSLCGLTRLVLVLVAAVGLNNSEAALTFTELVLETEAGTSHSYPVTLMAGSTVPVPILAGSPFTKITLKLAVPIPSPSHLGLLAFVPVSTTELQATAGDCGDLKILDAGPGLDGTTSVPGTLANGGSEVIWDLTGGLINFLSMSNRRRSAIKVGGDFKLCFADGGSWLNGGYLVPSPETRFQIYGAFSYPNVNLMIYKKHYCFSGGLPGTNCKINIAGAVGNTSDGQDWAVSQRLTWAQPVSYEDTCGVTDPVPTIGIGAVGAPFLRGSGGGLAFDLGHTYQKFEARNFWMCYCPGFDNSGGSQPCTVKEDFRQMVGRLYVFNAKQSVATIVPVVSFDLTIECGRVNGCGSTANNRIKIVDRGDWRPRNNINNLPIWDPSSGCRISEESLHYISPANCVMPTDCSSAVNGGKWEDEKYFYGLKMDNAIVEGISIEREFDVCYCDDDCTMPYNWFKVGTFNVSRARIQETPLTPQESLYKPLAVANRPGVLQLGTIPNDYPDKKGGVTNSLRTGSLFKLLVEAEGQTVTDAKCARAYPRAQLFVNHGCITKGRCYPLSWRNDSAQRITFNAKYYYGGLYGQSNANDTLFQDPALAITMLSAGNYAVCYCEDNCDADVNWARFTLLQIRGPTPGQTWFFQTKIPFDMVIKGTGLSPGNMIRVLASDARCDNDYEGNWPRLKVFGQSAPAFNATVLSHESEIWTNLGNSGPNYIVGINDFFKQGTELTFTHDSRGVGVKTLVAPGDTIVISNATVDINGVYPYLSPATTDHQAMIEVSWGHKIASQVPDDETGTHFTIPVVLQHVEGDPPTWSSTLQAHWTRTSEEVLENIESSEARSGLRVCWSDSGSSNSGFVAEVGVLELLDAPLMTFSTANLVTTTGGAIAPMVLAFQTAASSAAQYRNAVNSMMLKVEIMTDRMSFRMSDANATEVRDEGARNGVGREDQIACGMLFRELWSSHPNGFPVPKGCFYLHYQRAYHIVFDPKNGLAESSEYQIVFNVETFPVTDESFWDTNSVARVTSLDDIVLRRQFAVEVGVCYLRPDRVPAPARNGSSAIRFAPGGGFSIIGLEGTQAASTYIDLSSGPNFESIAFEIIGAADAPIRKGQRLRMALFPLTAWHLWGGCEISCLYADQTQGLTCGGKIDVATCSTSAVCAHSGAYQNMADLSLPLTMSPVSNLTGPLRLVLSQLALPPGGFFPGRVGLELRSATGEGSDWAWSQGLLLYAPPTLAFGGVVGSQVGDGNERPFRGDFSNILYVRLQLGANLRSQPVVENGNFTAGLELKLPNGYTCTEVSTAPDDLKIFGSDIPQGRGGLPNASTMSSFGPWELISQHCRFELAPWTTIFAGSAIFLRIVVNNPVSVLQMSDPVNTWRVSVHSFGELTAPSAAVRPPASPLLGGGLYSSNAAVQGKLSANLVPMLFMPGNNLNALQVFFITEQDSGARSQLQLLGPASEPFDFGKRCQLSPLDENYYVDVSPHQSTFPLPGMTRQITCNGLQSADRPSRYYGAVFELSGRLRAGLQYGFAIRVGNPSPEPTAAMGDNSWSLLTLTEFQEQIDGTTSPAPMNPQQAELSSFGLFKHQPALLDPLTSPVLQLASRYPSSSGGGSVYIAIGGIQFPSTASCVLRVIAPALFVWSYLRREFMYTPSDLAPYLPNSGKLPDGSMLVQENLPVGYMPAPLVQPLNELISEQEGSFKGSVRYGLAGRARVPDVPTTGSADAFFLLCGASEKRLGNRHMAIRLPAPKIAALVDAMVGYTSNIAGASNRLTFGIRTATDLATTGALAVRGPVGFVSPPNCSVLATDDSLNNRTKAVRAQLLAYEALVELQAVQETALGTDAPIVALLASQASSALTVLKAQVASLWKDRAAARALPLDMGCFWSPEDPLRGPFLELTIQVGFPNLDVDARLSAFARLHAPEVFPAEKRGQTWLLAGRYQFLIAVTNPPSPRSNSEVSASTSSSSSASLGLAPSGCGFEQCWGFSTFASPYSLRLAADHGASAAGFAVVVQMPEARLLALGPEQRLATGRNDRPTESNQLVFSFSLGKVYPEGAAAVGRGLLIYQRLVLRGPVGYEFPEDCSVITSQDAVFGRPDLWPGVNSTLANWTSEAAVVTSCLGKRNSAYIELVGQTGLQPGMNYSFRIDIQANPEVVPMWNRWTLEFFGQRPPPLQNRGASPPSHAESAEPFLGFGLWTFSDIVLQPRTVERSSGDRADTAGGVMVSEIKFLWVGFNDVPPGGRLRLQAPARFVWLGMSGTNLSSKFLCDIQLLERPDSLLAAAMDAMSMGSLGISFWRRLPVSCSIHPTFAGVLLLQLPDPGVTVRKGIQYALVASIVNPAVEISQPGVFEFASAQSVGNSSAAAVESSQTLPRPGLENLLLLDVVDVSGFAITKGVGSMVVTTESGGYEVPGEQEWVIRISVSFVEPVFAGDVLRFRAPPGYGLSLTAVEGSSSATGTALLAALLKKACIKVRNRSKPGARPDQDLRCFSGLFCALPLVGHSMGPGSHVQLSRLDRPCGGLPGRDVDSRRSIAETSATGDGTLTEYNLGFDLALNEFRVCYCHGEDGCDSDSRFCQDAGVLTVADLCAKANCAPAPGPCLTRCDPRTGQCVADSDELLEAPDGATCSTGGNTTGRCEAGLCVATGLSTPSTSYGGTPCTSCAQVPASCRFDKFECVGRKLVWTVGHQGFTRLQLVYLEVSAMHPPAVPPEDNDFALTHERGRQVRGTRVVEAYGIRPQFRQVSVLLVGRLRAGGSLSELELRFESIQVATLLWVRAKEPLGFDFSDAFIPQSNGTLRRVQGDTLEIEAEIRPGMLFILRIYDVRLPPEGGPGLFDVLSYKGTELKDSAYDVAAFRTPAYVDVSQAALLNQYKRDTSGQFRVEASYGNRLGEWAQLQFRLGFSAEVPAPFRLRLTAESWRSSPLSAQVEEQLLDGTSRSVAAPSSAEADLQSDGSAATLDLAVSTSFVSKRLGTYFLTVDVFAPESEKCLCWLAGACQLCRTDWTIEALIDGFPMPVATNDGLFVGFPLVSEVSWAVFAARTPPQATLDLTFRFTQTGAVPATVVIITAPLGYEFPYVCFSADFQNATAVPGLPVFTTCTGRLNLAMLSLDEQGLYRATTVMLSLVTPRATPTDNRWYLEGRQLAGNTQVSWGATIGLISESLQQVSVDYAAFQTLHTVFLLRVTSQVGTPIGGSLVFLPPAGYVLLCDGLRTFGAPGANGGENFTGVSDFQALSCTGLRQGVQIRFNLAALRAAQEYSFAFEGGTAAASAPDKVADAFSLQVLEPGGRVVGSSYDIAAMRLRDFGSVKSPYLIWYDSPSPLGSLFVTFGLEISSRAPAGLQAIRFVLPDGLRHAAASSPRDAPTTSKSVTVAWRPSEVTKTPAGTFGDFAAWTLAEQSVGKGDAATTPVPEQPAADSNATNNGIAPSMTTPVPLEALPLLEDTYGWVNLGVRDQVEVRFNPSRPFPACELLVRFPVTLPNSLPALNVWRVTLVFAPSATDTGDEPPLTSFVVPGFGFGAISPANLVQHAQHVFQYSGHDYYEFSAEQANPATREAGFHSALVAGGLLLLGAWL